MFDQGVRLQILIGATVPVPAPYQLMDALTTVEVENNDRDFDGFKLSFALTKTALRDFDLLSGDLLEPPSRVIIAVTVGVLPQVLIDGVITRHEVTASTRPGASVLHVYGRDISQLLDLEERSATYRNQADSVIVQRLLLDYPALKLVPDVTSTEDFPVETDRVPSQQGTDLSYIRALALRNGFVFYIEPTVVPGINTAYWGRENRLGAPQPELAIHQDSQANVNEPMSFAFDALAATDPEVSILEPTTRLRIPVPVPVSPQPPLVTRAGRPLRRTIPRGTANLSLTQALLRSQAATSDADEVATTRGEVNTVRYGHVLQARRLVKVVGAGSTNSGTYYVKRVTHRLSRGQYKQSFELTREGRGALI